MKAALLIMLLFPWIAMAGPQSARQQRPTLGSAPETTRPTLGAPSIQGPGTSKIMDPRALKGVRTVYVEMMDNFLSAKLIADLNHGGPFRVVAHRNEADAVLDGSCFDLPDLKDVHSEVYLTGKNGKAIWQDIIHEPYRPPSLSVAVTKTAGTIVTHLRESILTAERH